MLADIYHNTTAHYLTSERCPTASWYQVYPLFRSLFQQLQHVTYRLRISHAIRNFPIHGCIGRVSYFVQTVSKDLHKFLINLFELKYHLLIRGLYNNANTPYRSSRGISEQCKYECRVSLINFKH